MSDLRPAVAVERTFSSVDSKKALTIYPACLIVVNFLKIFSGSGCSPLPSKEYKAENAYKMLAEPL